LRQRELGCRDSERLAQSVLEMTPKEREALGIRLSPSLTAENLSRSLRYLSKGSPEYRATKVLQETLRDKKEREEGYVGEGTRRKERDDKIRPMPMMPNGD